LALMLPPNPLVINIGAGAGTSGVAFMESRSDLSLITIDITDLSSPFGCLEAERQELAKVGLLNERTRQIHGDSVTVGLNYEDAPVDMVFIDGDHSYDGCCGDIWAWFPHIKAGGIIAVHDYKKGDIPFNADGPHPVAWPGVDNAVDEWLLSNFTVVLWIESLIAFRV
jgi:predicted O-methyltransferase YrrM